MFSRNSSRIHYATLRYTWGARAIREFSNPIRVFFALRGTFSHFLAHFSEFPSFWGIFVIFTTMGGIHQKGHFRAQKGPRGDFGLEKVWFPLGFSMVGGGCPQNAPRRNKSRFRGKVAFLVILSENGGF